MAVCEAALVMCSRTPVRPGGATLDCEDTLVQHCCCQTVLPATWPALHNPAPAFELTPLTVHAAETQCKLCASYMP